MSGYAEYREVNLPWLKAVPAHWEIRRNKNIFTEQKEIVGERSADYTLLSLTLNGIIPRDMDGGGKFPESFDKYKIVKNGDMVFCLFDIDETPRTVGLSGYNGMLTGAYTIMRVSNINARFIYYYYLALDNGKMLRPLYTGLRKTININTFQSTKVPVPPREEQDQIVRFLDWKVSNINKLINIKKNMIALLENRKKSIINGVLAGGASNAVCKESVIEGLLTIPTTWDERPLKFYASSNDESLSSKTPSNYKFNYIDISTTGFRKLKKEPVFTTFEEAPSRARRIVREGDTILSTVRTYLKAILYIDNTKDGNVVSTGFAVLRPKDGVYPPLLSYALSCDYFINAVIRNSVGVSYPAINDKKLLSLKLALPKSYDEQVKVYEQIMALTESTDITIKYLQDMVNGLQDLKNRLVADTVTGKIDVRSIEIPEYEFVDEDNDNVDENLEQGADEPPEEE